MKSGEKWQEISEKKTCKDLYYFLHDKALGQGQIPPGDKILIVNNKFYNFYYFNHTL